VGYRVDWWVSFVVVPAVAWGTVGAIQQSVSSARVGDVLGSRGWYPVA